MTFVLRWIRQQPSSQPAPRRAGVMPRAAGQTCAVAALMVALSVGCKYNTTNVAQTPPTQVVPVPGPVIGPVGGKVLSVTYAIGLERLGAMDLVSDRTVLTTGTTFRVQLSVPQDSFVYLFNQNTDGSFAVLFPDARVAGGSQRLAAGTTTVIPPLAGGGPAGGRYQGYLLAPPAGSERLVLCVSDAPVPELDRIVAGPVPGTTLPVVLGAIRDVQTTALQGGGATVSYGPTGATVALTTNNPRAVLVHEFVLEHRMR